VPATIGIDLGGTKCHGVVLNGDGEIVAEHRAPTKPGNDGVVQVLVDVASALCEKVPEVAGVGAGVPGLVDGQGILRVAPNVPGVRDLDVKGELERRLGLPVVVDNDVTAACWAERELGAARGATDCLLVALGTGIGGGIVAGGRLVRGAHGYAGEFGHMIVDPSGPVCVCGQRGCWERYASGSGLGWLAREAAARGDADAVVALAGGVIDSIRGEHVTAAAAGGDAGAQLIMSTFARWIGLGLANLANAFDPTIVVLGGGLIESGDVLMGPVRAALDELSLAASARPQLQVVPAALGERAGSIGAALLARGPSSAYGR
jgi:glucokinase